MSKAGFLLLFFSYSLLSSATLNQKPLENSLVVYSGSIALVHEKRMLNIKKDQKEIIYEGVANTIVTNSINIKLPPSIKLYSQQCRFDKLTHAKLLEAHINSSISYLDENSKEITATLLAYDSNNVLIETKDNKIISIAIAKVIFNSNLKEFITKPSLVWNVSLKEDIKAPIEIDYLIQNLNYTNSYTLNIDKNSADLSGWIEVDNRTGKAFVDTELSLMAGDINRQGRANYHVARAVKSDSSFDVSHQAHEGYHLYTIPFRVDIANQEKSQIKFLEQKDIKFKRNYSVVVSNPISLKRAQQHAITQSITLEAQNFVLPKGVIRTYSKLNNQTILLAENTLMHTAKDTPIELELGKNFDTKIEEELLQTIKNEKYIKNTIRYTIFNNSDEEKRVKTAVPFNRKSDSVIKTTQKYSFTKGDLATFILTLKPNSKKSFEVIFTDMK